MGHFKRASYDRDEELGKRDDNYRPWTASNTKKTPLRWRRRRVFIFLLLAIGVYLFVHNIPTDLGSIDSRLGRPLRPGHVIGGKDFGRAADAQQNVFRTAPQPPTGPPPRAEKKGKQRNRLRPGEKLEEEEHYYSGPIKFYKLKASLDAIGTTGGHRMTNKNVLFAASKLKSASNLLPLACAMAEAGRNYVHLVLLGREALAVEDVLKMNGVSQKTCDVYIHDGRADYSEYSTDIRAEASVVGAMNHVNSWMHPQVVIVDDEKVEDTFFIKGIRGKMKDLERPVIELPSGRYDDFKWMTRLDSTSLSSWHKPRIEMLVHDPPGAGGALTRLLKSLTDADYGGLKPPKLTVELPSRMDDFLIRYLKDFKWPPGLDTTRPQSDLLKLQRRIPANSLDAEESSVRFVESYYPSHNVDDHVLILSPNAVVSPIFYHYIMFTLLSTRYSASNPERERLAGLTLASSDTTISGKKFTPPSISDMRQRKSHDFDTDSSPPFLYQVPQSSAMLIFGDKWAEFHDYLTRRLHSLHAHPDTAKPKRLFTKSHPAWLEFFLELVRARSWAFLYPSDSHSGTWATIHTELYHPPDDYQAERKPDDKTKSGATAEKPKSSEPFLTAEDDDPAMPRTAEKEKPAVSGSQSLDALLPFGGGLPDLAELPLLSYKGTELGSLQDAEEDAVIYVKELRQNLGGCTAAEASKPKNVREGKTGDLFCYEGREGEEWEVKKVDMRMFNPSHQREHEEGEDMGMGRLVEDENVKKGGKEEEGSHRVYLGTKEEVEKKLKEDGMEKENEVVGAGKGEGKGTKKLAHEATDLGKES
ncbi:hypothetical protein C1H76_0111 [Elsinoe australis]|uniref:Uncharacterized protein n=1 Tax=Elsinoe australis TaxID=40998 RepID=A0A4U7BC42_9PEZI|nr:hypothetical protein C1H76_0111 [Elsinoe australis]